ncbi:MAG: hypothetical protein EA368_14765 [Leptolyngbya sp. DLM2.Bin27]|nr:MAG: hypothetical protein EA368_14765 [Leptolyngbya sp. DLM2.Bin27]
MAIAAALSPSALPAAESHRTWLGLGRLRTFLSGGPLQDNNRGRDGGSRGSGFCLIAPGEGEMVWAVEPTLVFQGDLKSAALFAAAAEEPFWLAPISPTATFVATLPYDGDPLQPGTTYEQQLEGFRIDFSPVSSRRFSFQIMPEGEDRDQIDADLAQLDAELTQAGAATEAIAQARAAFFFERNLTADALGALFSVAEPSADLAALRSAIAESICRQTLPAGE